MNSLRSQLASGTLVLFGTLTAAAFCAAAAEAQGTTFRQTNLVSGTAPGAPPAPSALHTDNQLQNSWGIAFGPNGPFWIADNNSGLATIYDGQGNKVPLTVTIPPASGETTPAAPTGIVFNTTGDFSIPGTGNPAVFILDGEDGTVTAWAGGNTATLIVDQFNGGSLAGSVFKGLALATSANGNFLYAANFRLGRVDVFDANFNQVPLGGALIPGTFTDPNLPAGFAPFGIHNINGDLFVTYAKQNAQKHDDVSGPGNGFVDVYSTSGFLLRRFATQGNLNSPWGVVEAPFGFGEFNGAILVGNFGDGKINAFDPQGNFIAQLKRPTGQVIVIDDLWSLTLGGAASSNPDALYFTSGPQDERNGLFGRLDVSH